MVFAQQWTTVAPWVRKIAPLVHPEKIRNYAPVIATWGAAAGITVLFFLEPTPIARTDIFQNIPVVGGFWKHKLEAREQKD
ncbi:hypothetical protein SpCBS45565_g00805 [Spizellomyces sp. 'palustris']|nr:hypothetical protein SpCBS45565_g00805 [Spizellomyces sp. 'palustris']